MRAIPVTFPGAMTVKMIAHLCHLSLPQFPAPLPRTLPGADGQLCFPFISAADEDILAKGKQSIKSQALGNQNSENEILPEGDDDTLSSVDEKDLENLTGKFSACKDISTCSGPISI